MAQSSYRDLVAWQKGVDLVEQVYRVTEVFPKYELYGLTSQVRRASVSIPSNIAEGQARTKPYFERFLTMARGSLFEVETQLIIANRLDYLSKPVTTKVLQSTDRLSRIISGLINSLG